MNKQLDKRKIRPKDHTNYCIRTYVSVVAELHSHILGWFEVVAHNSVVIHTAVAAGIVAAAVAAGIVAVAVAVDSGHSWHKDSYWYHLGCSTFHNTAGVGHYLDFALAVPCPYYPFDHQPDHILA